MLSKLAKAALSLIVIFLAGFAVFFLVARLSMPLLNSHVKLFENWTSSLLRQPVKIGYVRAWWSGLHPELQLEDVTIFNTDKKQIIFHLNKLKIDVSVIRSLLTRTLQPNDIVVTGVDLNIYQNQTHSVKFQLIDSIKKTNHKNDGHALGYSEIFNWLSKRRRLLLENVHVTWYKNQAIVGNVLLHNLLFANQKHQHIINGGGYVNQDASSSFDFYLGFKGKFVNFGTLQASLYAKLKNLDLSKWCQLLKLYGYQIDNGILNGQFWINWNQGQIKSVQSLLHAEKLNLTALDHSHAAYTIPKLSGNFLWQPVQQGWKLLADHFYFDINNVVEPENKFALIVQHDKHGVRQYFWSHYFYLESLPFLFAHNNFLPTNTRNLLSHLNPSGELINVKFVHHGNFNQINNYDLSAQLNQVATQYWQHIPGAKNISGDLKLRSGNGSLHIMSNNSYFNFGKLFSAPVIFNKMSGHVQWSQMQDKSWWVKSDDLSVNNSESAINTHVAMLFPANKFDNPMISLLAEFDLHDSSIINKYLPMKMFTPKLAHWLGNAFVRGDGVIGKVILRGKLNDFPFDHHEGVFIVDSKFRNTSLHYADGWPDADNIDADLKIKDRNLNCDLIKGKVFKSNIKSMHVAINDIGKKPAVVKLTTSIASNASDILHYVGSNDLHKMFNQVVQSAEAAGMVNLNFNMFLPVEKPSAVKLSGAAVLQQNDFELPAWNLGFQELNGKLLFTENKLWSQNLQAKIFNYPAKITAQFFRVIGKNQQNKIHLESRIDMVTLKNNFHWLDFPFIHGKTNYTAEFVSMPTGLTGKANYLLNITSDLQGIAMDLPAPLAKTAQQIDPFSMQIQFGNAIPITVENTKLKTWFHPAVQYEASPTTQFVNRRNHGIQQETELLLDPVVKPQDEKQRDESHILESSSSTPIKAKINLDDTLSAALQWHFKNHHPYFYSANIHFGTGQGTWQQLPGLYVDGSLPTFNWRVWRNFLQNHKEVGTANNKIQLMSKIKKILREVNLKVATIKFLNKQFNNLIINFKPSSTAWLLKVVNDNITGNIVMPDDYPQRALKINLKYLKLMPTEFAANKTSLLEPAEVPPMDIKIDDFVFGQQDLGKVNLSLRTSKNIAQIKSFDISSPTYSVSTQGYWKKLSDGKYQSMMRGDIESNNIMPLLTALNIHSGLVIEEGSAQFNLIWPNVIYHLDIQHAVGDVYMHLGKGQITGIGENANQSMNLGRILTLLSVNRFLTGGFSDLFQDGYSFNKMQGSLSLRNGKINIKNLNFNGAVASIDILGDVNMLMHNLNLRLAITPYITSSVPVVAGIIGGPIVGVTAFLANKVLGKVIDQIATYHYVVTGGWKHPKITKVQQQQAA
ncbi:MAG: DUF3971 domain-containing protein [Gammaproteobacteria bacterium]|jgi:uncharacterized protein YhdP